jgi:hypothetical protein
MNGGDDYDGKSSSSRCSKKGKLSRYTPWRHMGGERRYSSCSYLTSALDGGEWSALRPDRSLPPGKGPPVSIGYEAGWAPEPVWTQVLEEKSSAPVGDRTPIVQPVVRHYTVWATAASSRCSSTSNNGGSSDGSSSSSSSSDDEWRCILVLIVSVVRR